jgi:hypothetical protein
MYKTKESVEQIDIRLRSSGHIAVFMLHWRNDDLIEYRSHMINTTYTTSLKSDFLELRILLVAHSIQTNSDKAMQNIYTT